MSQEKPVMVLDKDPGTADLVVYSHDVCPFAQRTRILLSEKKQTFEYVYIDLSVPRPAWYLELNPLGKVPCIKHKGKVLYESAIVGEYLDEVLPGGKLLPEDPYNRAIARIWIDYCNNLVKAYYPFLMNQDRDKDADFAKKLDNVLEFVENGLAKYSNGGPYFLGKQYSMIDITYIPFFERFLVIKHYRNYEIPEKFKRLHAWIAECKKRESWQKTKMDPKGLITLYAKYAGKK